MRRNWLSNVAVGCLAAMAMTVSVGLGQTPSPSAALPDGLRHVPAGAMAFVHFRVGDFLKSENGAALLAALRLDLVGGTVLQKLEKTLGVEIAQLDSLTLVMLAPSTIQRPSIYPPTGVPKWGSTKTYEKKKIEMKFEEKKLFEKEVEKKKEFFEKEVEKKIEGRSDGQSTSFTSFQDSAFQPDLDDFVIEGANLSEPLIIAASTRPLDRKKILRAGLFPEVEHRYSHGDPGILFLSERCLLVGHPWQIARYNELMASDAAPKTQSLKSALALGGQRHLVVAGGHIPAAVRRNVQFMHGPDGRALASVLPLLRSEAGLTLDLDKNADITLQFLAPNEASAELTLEAVKTLRVLAELGLEKAREAGEPGGWRLTLEKALKQCLASASIEKQELTVRTKLKLEIDPALYKGFAREFLTGVRLKGDRTRSTNNLKMIGLAMHNYHDTYKFLPPAGISNINDPNGKPLLSWRVAILPFIEQTGLYQQFDLTLPWDHPRNKKLIERMPEIYVVPGTGNFPPGLTNYRVLVGPGTMFEPRQGPGGRQVGWRLVEVTDGTSNTFMVVEAAEPTIWTRPDDLPYDPKGPLPKLGVTGDGFNALFGDGAVRFFRSNTQEEIIRACITRNGGEAVALPD